jgi:hypothetical protein
VGEAYLLERARGCAPRPFRKESSPFKGCWTVTHLQGICIKISKNLADKKVNWRKRTLYLPVLQRVNWLVWLFQQALKKPSSGKKIALFSHFADPPKQV